MDTLIVAAARALAAGDPLSALKRVALRNDAPALALRGIAMAQLGDLARAKVLLRKAARGFGTKQAVARARCIVAEAEIALVSRDLSSPAAALATAQATLERHGDRIVRDADTTVSLATHPILFALARTLGEAWPADVSRGMLLARAFRAKHADESHRARLRVEVRRLRVKLRGLADVNATTRGFALAPRRAREVVVFAPPVEDAHASVLAFLADGESWSSSALSLALGSTARTVQRALDSLAGAGKVQSCGRGRARRWITQPMPGFTTTLLLPGPLPGD